MEDRPDILRRACRAYIRGGLVFWLAACTLLDDPFEPTLVQRDAGLADSRSSDTSAVADGAGGSSVLPLCSGSLGSDVDRACLASTPSLSPVPAEPDSGRAEDSPAAPAAVASSACAGGFGEFGAPERVTTGLESSGNLFGPALSADGLGLFFSVSAPPLEQIYSATRAALDTALFSNAGELPIVNSAALDGSPFVSADDLRIVFFSDRRAGVGGRDIWFGQRTERGAAFSTPTLLQGVNTPNVEHLPWLSADELTLLFVSNRANGRDSDIWRATRTQIDAAFDAGVSAADLNSSANEGRAVLSSDRLSAIFSSERAGGLGSADIWLASRTDPELAFSAPINLAQLNSDSADQDVALSRDEHELLFSSARDGTNALWRSLRSCR
jgi:hypothetical protein